MILTSIEKWYDDIRLEVPGAPNPLIKKRIVLAAQEICKRTMLSQDTLDPVDIEAGEAVYQLETISSCLKIWRVLWVKTPERILTQAVRRNLIAKGQDWEKDTGEAAVSFVNLTASKIQLLPAPTKAISDGFTAYVAFIPDPRTSRLDDRLFTYYKEAVTTGALSKLLRIKNTPWYDRIAAREREAEFQVELSKISANTSKEESVADLSVAMRPF